MHIEPVLFGACSAPALCSAPRSAPRRLRRQRSAPSAPSAPAIPFGARHHFYWLSQTELQNTMEIIRSAPALFGASVRRLFGASSVRRKRSAPFGAVRRQASVRRLFGAGADLSAPGAEQHCCGPNPTTEISKSTNNVAYKLTNNPSNKSTTVVSQTIVSNPNPNSKADTRA